MSITVTISDKKYLAALDAAAAQDQSTAQAYAEKVMTRELNQLRDAYHADRITSAAFVLRFTEAEYAAVKASGDAVVQGFIARLDTEPFVWLGSEEVQQAMAYVVGLGLITQARADAILAY